MRSKVEAVGHYDTYFREKAFNFLQEAQPKDRLFDISLRYAKVLLPKARRRLA